MGSLVPSAAGNSLSIDRGLWRRIALVALVAVAHQLVPLGVTWKAAVQQQAKNFTTEDAWMYRGMADLIRDHGLLYDSEEYNYEIRVRMPGYPLVILATDWIGGLLGVSGAWVLTLSQLAMTCASCLLISRIAANLTTERTGTIVGVIAALAPGNAIYTLEHMPEAPSTTLWLASLYLCVRGLRTRSKTLLIGGGVCLAVAATFKPVFLFCWVPACLSLALLSWPSLRAGMKTCLLFLVGFLIGLMPAYVRNYLIWQEPVFCPQYGSQLYLCVRPSLLKAAGVRILDPTNRLALGVSDPRVPATKAAWEQKFGSSWDNLAKRHTVYGRLAWEDICGHLPLYFKLFVTRQPRTYAGTGTLTLADDAETNSKARVNGADPGFQDAWPRVVESGLKWYQLFTWAVLGATYAGAMAGVVVLVCRRQFSLLLAILLHLAYFAQLMTLFPHTRYRFPMMYLFALLAGIALAALRPISLARTDSVR